MDPPDKTTIGRFPLSRVAANALERFNTRSILPFSQLGRSEKPQPGEKNIGTAIHLPYDLLLLIMTSIRPATTIYRSFLWSCCLTSRSWNAASTPLLYRDVSLKDIFSIIRFYRTIQQKERNLGEFVLTVNLQTPISLRSSARSALKHAAERANWPGSSAALACLLEHCPNLLELGFHVSHVQGLFEGPTRPILPEFCDNIVFLQVLKIKGDPTVVEFLEKLPSLPNLKQLVLEDTKPFPSKWPSFPTLRSLTIINTHADVELIFSLIDSVALTLQHLSLQLCTWSASTADSINWMPELPELRSIYISPQHSFMVTTLYDQLLRVASTGLEELTILGQYCPPPSIVPLFSSLCRLTVSSTSGFELAAPYWAAPLASGAPFLSYLGIHCPPAEFDSKMEGRLLSDIEHVQHLELFSYIATNNRYGSATSLKFLADLPPSLFTLTIECRGYNDDSEDDVPTLKAKGESGHSISISSAASSLGPLFNSFGRKKSPTLCRINVRCATRDLAGWRVPWFVPMFEANSIELFADD